MQGSHEELSQLSDFHARQYDAALGRWFGVDPQNQFASPYTGMGNNPVMYMDPDGEWVHIAIGAVVGGVFNVATNWSNIQGSNIWQKIGSGASYFGVGAAAGAVGAGTGNFAAAGAIVGGGNATLQGGSIGDIAAGAVIGGVAGYVGGVAGGKVSSALAGQNISGFLGGFASGAAGGAAGGFVNGFGSGLYFTGNLGEAFNAGGQGALYGGIFGGVAGGLIGGFNDSRAVKGYDSDGNPTKGNFWTGRERGPGRSAFAFNNSPKSGTGYIQRTIMDQESGGAYKLRYSKDITTGSSTPNYEVTGQNPQQVWNDLTNGRPFNPNSVNVHTLSNGTKIVYYPKAGSTGQPSIVHQKTTKGNFWKIRFRGWR